MLRFIYLTKLLEPLLYVDNRAGHEGPRSFHNHGGHKGLLHDCENFAKVRFQCICDAMLTLCYVSVLHAKALYYQETLCRKEDIQKFLSSLVSKKPEVGHLVKCFHVSKSADTKTNSGRYFNRDINLEIRLCCFENFCLYDLSFCVRPLDSNTWRRQFTVLKSSPEYKVPKLWLKYLNKLRPGHKVVTYSTVENFEFQTWKDFSDLRLIEPSRDYPVIEVRGVKIDSSNCEALICRISQK